MRIREIRNGWIKDEREKKGETLACLRMSPDPPIWGLLPVARYGQTVASLVFWMRNLMSYCELSVKKKRPTTVADLDGRRQLCETVSRTWTRDRGVYAFPKGEGWKIKFRAGVEDTAVTVCRLFSSFIIHS